MKKKSYAKICFALSVPFLLSSIGYGSWLINSKEESVVVSGPKVQDVPVAYILGSPDIKYTKIERALDVAKSGDIVIVIPLVIANNQPNIDKVTYKIERDCTIKEGVTLFIPTDKASEGKVTNASTLSSYIDYLKKPKRDQGESGYEGFAENNQSKYLRVTVEIEAGKKLTNNGTLLISGFLSGGTNGECSTGQTSHSYSRIVLNQGSSIVQDNANAKTYCFGFIEESSLNNNSLLDLKKGELYIPVVINDYRGFIYSYAMTAGAINNDRCSVFNLMEFRNVKSLTKIGYNASVQGIINIYVKYDTLNVNDTITVEKGVIGTTNKFLIQQTNSAYSFIEYKYNSSAGIFKAKCYGGFTFNYLSLDLKLSSQTLKLSTQNAYFPLSYKFDIELLCGSGQNDATFNISNQRMKILTGSKLYLGDNVTLSGNELIVYSAFFDGEIGTGQGVYTPGRSGYPLKENGILQMADTAKVTMNKMAGNVYSNNPSNIIVTTKSIISKEPWYLGNSGGLNPPWAIKDFLEINEVLSIVGTDFLNKKKICVGVNTFTSTNTYKPYFNVNIENNSENVTVEGTQKVIFSDSISTFGFEFLFNIYKLYYSKTLYQMNSQVPYNDSNRLVCAINSDRSISSNTTTGTNEFDVQSVEILGSTHDVPQGTVLQLDKKIVDIDKCYDKNFTWSSLDPSICIVNENGLVTGVGIGTTSIKLSCGGKEALYEINVTASTNVEGLQKIEITEPKGTASGGTFKDGKYVFNAKLIGENGNILSLNDIGSINWILKPEAAKRAYFDNDDTLVEKSGVLTVNVQLNGGYAASSNPPATPDTVYLTCKVIDKKGKEISSQFIIVNDNACLAEGTDILMADGTLKKVEILKVGELVKVFNHETGKLDVSPIIFITHKEEGPIVCQTINLVFENNIELKIVKDHALFDKTTNRYEVLNKESCKDFIGHEFAIIEKDVIETVKLLSADVTLDRKRLFCPVTAFHMNLFANKLLTMPTFPYHIHGLYNIFKLDETMKYDEEQKKVDIENYGLYSYEEFTKLINISIDAYNVSPAVYLKISLGKGLITKEQIILGINYLLDNGLIDAYQYLI